jgi:Flp pilus assembly pilin Flp
MARAIAIVVTLVAAGLFAWQVPFVRLFDALGPLITALSIMVAAVFVRLNRGMPALEWKSVEPDDRRGLTAAILHLTIEYGRIIGIIAVVLGGLVTLSVIGKIDASLWPEWARRLASGAVGGLVSLCAARMAYVVWRDIDIVRLQKRIIDSSASRESTEQHAKLADDKVANIRAANLRPAEVKPPKAWGD